MTKSAIRNQAPIEIRPYSNLDASGTLTIFVDAITVTASADYTAEQTEAWVDPVGRDLRGWDNAMAARGSFVAIIEGQLAGFSDVSHEGYVDMMFVAPRFLGRGVAWQLLAHGEALARALKIREMSADVGITARPFFERQGFTVEVEQCPVKRGVPLTNFKMLKALR